MRRVPIRPPLQRELTILPPVSGPTPRTPLNSSTVADKLVVDRAVWEGAKALAPAMARRKAQADFMVTIVSVLLANRNDEGTMELKDLVGLR